MTGLFYILAGVLAVYGYQSYAKWFAKQKAKSSKIPFDSIEKELGIVGEDGCDPELEAWRLKRIQKWQKELEG